MLVFWNVVAPDGPKSENLPSCVEELTNFPLSKNFETFFLKLEVPKHSKTRFNNVSGNISLPVALFTQNGSYNVGIKGILIHI
mgnify:CR=1 FL=1